MAKSKQDYRVFLKEKILIKRGTTSKYSQSFFAKKIGVSKSYLTAVLSQKKHLSAEKLDLLCEFLRFTDDEYLSALISHAQSHSSRKYFAKVMRSIQRERQLFDAAALKTVKSFSAKEKNLCVDEVRSTLFSLMPSIPNGDIKKAHEALRNKSISLEETKKALAWLVKNEFLKLEVENGLKQYKASQSFIRSQYPPGVQKYIPWLENSIQTLSNPIGFRPLRIQSMTFLFDDSTLLQLQNEYTALVERVQELSRVSRRDGKVFVMYLLNLSYPVASIDYSEES